MSDKRMARYIRRARRPRNSLLTGAIVFLMGQLCFAWMIETWLPQFRDPEFGRRINLLESRLAECPEKPFTVVMIGSSRTLNGFDPKPFETELEETLRRPVVAFNLGITGAGPMMEMFTLHRLLARGIRPDLVLLEIHPALLGAEQSRAESAPFFDPHQVYLADLPMLTSYCKDAQAICWTWARSSVIPGFSHRWSILSHIARWLVPYDRRIDWVFQLDQSGWTNLFGSRITSARRQEAVVRATIEYQETLRGLHVGGLPCQIVRDLLETCRREEIPTTLVLMPEGPLFRSWYSPIARCELDVFLRELRRTHDAPVINANEWMHENEFLDSHHLMADGAFAFSQRLARDAVCPMLKSRAAEKAWAAR
jgi:hypothetical protein